MTMFSLQCCSFYSFRGMTFIHFVNVTLTTQLIFVPGKGKSKETKATPLGALMTLKSRLII
jgi:hypothetical protein